MQIAVNHVLKRLLQADEQVFVALAAVFAAVVAALKEADAAAMARKRKAHFVVGLP